MERDHIVANDQDTPGGSAGNDGCLQALALGETRHCT